MVARRTTVAPQTNALDALLSLSGSLTRTKTGGVFSEALTAVFEGTGLHHGAVHEVTPTGLELVAEENLPAALRSHIGSFPAAESPWFVIPQAARRRRMLVEEDAAAMFGSRVSRTVVHNAGWDAVASAPILVGRDVFGVISVAAASGEVFTPDVLSVLEIAANMLAMYIARDRATSGEIAPTGKPAQVSDVDEKLTRLATLGTLATGYAEDLEALLALLNAQSHLQARWFEKLRGRHPEAAQLLAELEPMLEEAASSLRLARTSGSRLFAAFAENSAEIIDLAALVHEVGALVEPATRNQNVDVLVAVPSQADALTVGRRSEIRQLLQGLITDGIEACTRQDKPGKSTAPLAQKPIVSVNVTREKNTLVLVVEHSGKGSTTEHRRTTSMHVSATKEPLGLMLARNIAIAHGGTLEVGRSELGGLLVRVVLPAAPPPTASKRSSSGPNSSRRSRQTIPGMEGQHATSTKRDGWTTTPAAVTSSQGRPIRAPVPGVAPMLKMADVDTYAPTERAPGANPSVAPARARPAAPVVFADPADSAKVTVVVPPSTKKRSSSGQGPASRPKP